MYIYKRDFIPLCIFISKFFYAMIITILSFTSVMWLYIVLHFLILKLLHVIKVNDVLTDHLIDIFLISDIALLLFMLVKNNTSGQVCSLYFLILYISKKKKKTHATVSANSNRINFPYCLTNKKLSVKNIINRSIYKHHMFSYT